MAGWSTRMLALAAVTALMSACGGGNDNGATAGNTADAQAPAPAPAAQAPLAPTNLAVAYDAKTYNLSWNAAAGATSYDVYEDADGAGPQDTTRIATGVTGTAYSVALPVILDQRVAAQYSVRACNTAGCGAPSASLQPDVNQAIGYFASAGRSVALSRDGTTMAVGDASASGSSGGSTVQGSGAVDLWAKVDGKWMKQASLPPPAAFANQGFGNVVSLAGDGNTLAVAAFDDGAGGVHIYTRSGSAWTHQALLKAANAQAGDEFGISVSLSQDGNTVGVGARSEDSAARGVNGDGTDNTLADSGAAYVFTRSANAWAQQAYLKAGNADANDNFGQSVAISGDGNRLVVGAPGERSNAEGVDGDQSNNTVDSGAAYVFERSGGNWSQQHYLKAKNSGSSRIFGNAAAISADGSTIAIGSQAERSGSRGIDGSTTSVIDPNGLGSGAAWVFVATATSWQQQAYFKASNADVGDRFGASVSLSDDGSVLAVGAPQESSGATGINGTQNNDFPGSGSGATYLFRRTGTAWTQDAYLKPTKPAGSVLGFGTSVSLAGDGDSLAIVGPAAVSPGGGVTLY